MLKMTPEGWALDSINSAWGEWDASEAQWVAARNGTLLKIERHLAEVRRMEKSVEYQERQIKLAQGTKAALNTAYGLMAAHAGLEQ